MSEKDFFPKSLKNIVLSKDIKECERRRQSLKNEEKVAGNILSGLFAIYKSDGTLNAEVANTICDILSFKGTSEELGEKIKKLNDSIGDKTKAEDITLAVLLARLDTLDRANSKGKYKNLIETTNSSTRNYINRMYDNNGEKRNAWEEIQEFANYPASGQYTNAAFRGEINPSMGFVNTVVDVHMEKIGKLPEVETFGNLVCLLTRFGNNNTIELLKKVTNFESIYNLSSNTSGLGDLEKETLNDEILQGATISGLGRGNLNQMAELLRSFMISNFSIVDKVEGIYEDADKFNEFFFEAIGKFNEELIKNKNNQEIIRKINYMLNCPVHISGTGENLKTTTIADCVNFIMSSDKVNFISEEQRDILKKFADNIGVGKGQNKLTIPDLKIINRKEILKKNQDQKQQNKVKGIITVEGVDDDFFKGLKNNLTKKEKEEISSNLHGFLNNLIKEENSDKLLLTLQHYKNIFGDVHPMLKKFEKENKLDKGKKNFLAGVCKKYIDSKNPKKNRFEKLKAEKSHTNNIGIV